MMFNELSMRAVAAVLDVLEPIAVVHMERLNNLCWQVPLCGEFVQSCDCRLDRLMSRPGFFPSVLCMLAAPRIGKTQPTDYRWKHQPLPTSVTRITENVRNRI